MRMAHIITSAFVLAAVGCALPSTGDSEQDKEVTGESVESTDNALSCGNVSGRYRLVGCTPAPASAWMPIGTPQQVALAEVNRSVTFTQTSCSSLEIVREVRERKSDGMGCEIYGDCPFTGNWITEKSVVKPGVVWNSYRDEKRTTSFVSTGLQVVDENYPQAGYEKQIDTVRFAKTATGLTMTTQRWRKSTSYFQRNVPPTITNETCTFVSF